MERRAVNPVETPKSIRPGASLLSEASAFAVTAGLLVVSGVVCLGLSSRVIRDSAIQH